MHGFSDAPVVTATDYAKARQFWDGHRPRHYEWRYEVHCFCGPPRTETVQVDGSNVVARSAVQFGQPTSPDPASFSVDDALDDIGRKIGVRQSLTPSTAATADPGPPTDQPDVCGRRVTAAFDPTYGFPTLYGDEASTMTGRGQRCAVLTDGQWSFTAISFTVLEP